jgi:hypothetical protein
MDPRSLIRINAVRLQTLLQVEKLIANSMDPDQTAQTHYVGFVVMRLNLKFMSKYLPVLSISLGKDLVSSNITSVPG